MASIRSTEAEQGSDRELALDDLVSAKDPFDRVTEFLNRNDLPFAGLPHVGGVGASPSAAIESRNSQLSAAIEELSAILLVAHGGYSTRDLDQLEEDLRGIGAQFGQDDNNEVQ